MQLALSGRVEFLLPCSRNPLRSKQQLPWKNVWCDVSADGSRAQSLQCRSARVRGSQVPERCNAKADAVAASTLNFKSSLKAGPEAKFADCPHAGLG